MTTVGANNLLEIKLGKLARQKSHSHVVRVFAHWMIFDHTHVQIILKSMAQSQDLSSQVPASVNAHYTTMAKLSGKQFNQRYADFNVKGHKQAVSLLKQEEASDNNAKVSEFAASSLPIIEGYLMMAKHMQSVV